MAPVPHCRVDKQAWSCGALSCEPARDCAVPPVVVGGRAVLLWHCHCTVQSNSGFEAMHMPTGGDRWTRSMQILVWANYVLPGDLGRMCICVCIIEPNGTGVLACSTRLLLSCQLPPVHQEVSPCFLGHVSYCERLVD